MITGHLTEKHSTYYLKIDCLICRFKSQHARGSPLHDCGGCGAFIRVPAVQGRDVILEVEEEGQGHYAASWGSPTLAIWTLERRM